MYRRCEYCGVRIKDKGYSSHTETKVSEASGQTEYVCHPLKPTEETRGP